MFHSFHHIFIMLLHLQLLLHPTKPNFPDNFPFPKPYVSLTPTVTPTAIPSPTQTPSPTLSLPPTNTPTVTPTPTVSPTQTPTVTLTITPSATRTPTPTIIPTHSPSITMTPTATPTASPTPTVTSSPTPTPEPIGNDISYPQCGKSYPSGQLFGIVGVNGGIASTTNPCLTSELSWAAGTASSSAKQAKIQLYVNTGNPGGLNTITWPQNNTDPEGNATNNPYGTCDGSNSVACAWQYGWNRAVIDVVDRFIPAAHSAGISDNPTDYPWWLDVETANSWRDGSDEALLANTADLEGMVAYFTSREIKVGLYSTSFQWGQIVGTIPSGSNLNGLPSWLPGATDLAGAKTNCQKPPLTAGGEVSMTQFTTDVFDYDYSCK